MKSLDWRRQRLHELAAAGQLASSSSSRCLTLAPARWSRVAMSSTQDDCVREAIFSGSKAAAWAFATAGSAVFLADHFSHNFRTALGISGKLALVVSRLIPWYSDFSSPITDFVSSPPSGRG